MASFKLTCPQCVEFWGEDEVELASGSSDIIKGPGKFEGECVWAIHFWHADMDGFADYCTCETGRLHSITDEDSEHFPMLAPHRGQTIHTTESESGFAYVEILTEDELAAHEEELESDDEEE